MEDQAQAQTQTQTPPPTSPRTQCLERNHEPVRSRWTPKPEQILILESIFNSGMVNPPKDETVKIRKLLEKFGSVGDANVFYWFQNRRSNSSSSSTSSRLGGADEIYPVSSQAASFPEIEQNPNSMPSRVITVFINGVPTEVESGPFNMKALFGEDLMLVHSSGVPVPLSESGVCALGLQHGESYFLVSKFC
ncbi:Homeodomain-containing protein [Cynara cardunculus var. scolymus]|uniref:Protein WUSCHEL n=1 Tax=Cynara cardunculus var. scolymus TaxID=59895 RepID=A0A103YL94_CYNCS|nr:Homeodomain-containing protein [Cynara cardunculus var. scolymus]